MKYYVSHFLIQGNADLGTCRDIVAALAAEAGFESFEETPQGMDGYVQKDMLDKPMLRSLLDSFPVEGATVSYRLEEAEYKNWNEEWEQAGFEPIDIDGRCVIHDPQHPVPAREGVLDITIEARQAFGTGNHETTCMIVSELLKTDLRGKRLLDCGCGTGILGIVASKLGASEVVGYDIDEWSVGNANHNAELNGVKNMTVMEGNRHVLTHVNGLFDVVVANINRNILLEDLPFFCDVMKPGATLMISGFYAEDGIMLAEKAGMLGLTLKNTVGRNNWCALVFNA